MMAVLVKLFELLPRRRGPGSLWSVVPVWWLVMERVVRQ